MPLGVAVDGLQKRRLGKFFRDDDELAGASSLGAALKGAIEDSESLIVIASPNAAGSKWVNEEIRSFKQTHGADRIFAVIVDGRPFASEEGAPEEECFPLALRREVSPDGTISDIREEPLAPDVAKDSLPRIRARVAAGLLGLDFDALWRRDRRRRRRNAAIALCCTAVLGAGLGAGALRLDRAAQEAALQDSRRLAEQARGLMDEAQIDEALKLVVRALPDDLSAPDRPVAPEAIIALTRAMADNPDLGIAAQLDSGIDALAVTPQNALATRLGAGGFALLPPGAEPVPYHPDTHMTLTSRGTALRAFSAERSTDAGWVFDQSLIETDLRSGAKTSGFAFTDPQAVWFLTQGVLSPSGRYFAAKASGASRQGQVAVFKVPSPFTEAPQDPVGILQTGLKQIASARLGFTDDDTLVLFAQDEEGATLLRWPIGAQSPQTLRPLRAGRACPETSAALDAAAGKPHAAIAPDGRSITLATPTSDESWCLTSWDSATGAQLQQISVEDISAARIHPLSADRWLALPGASFFDHPVVLLADGGRWPLTGCKAGSSYAALSSLNAGLDTLVFIDDGQVACGDGTRIKVIGKDGAERVLASHTSDITTLAVAKGLSGEPQLWSGDASGVIRAWDLAVPVVSPNPGQWQKPVIARGQGVLAIVSAQDGEAVLSVWSPDGAMHLAPVPVPLMEAIETPGSLRQLALRIIGPDRALLTEAFRCPISLLGAPETDCSRSTGRASLLDLTTGVLLAQIDGLARGGDDLVRLALSDSTLFLLGASGDLQSLPLTGQQAAPEALPPEGQLRRIAWIGGRLWAATAQESTDTPEGHWRIYRRGENGWEGVLDQQVINITLHPSPDGNQGVILAETLSTTQAFLATDEGITLEGAPSQRQALEVLHPAGITGALLVGENGGVRLQSAGPMPPVPALSMIAGYDFSRRIRLSEDHSMLVWLGSDRADILGLPEGRALCTNLPLAQSSDAAFSPDGALLAVKSEATETVTLVDLATCAILRSLPSQGARPMVFADAQTLWQTAQNGRQVVTVPADPVLLLEKARSLVEKMQ